MSAPPLSASSFICGYGAGPGVHDAMIDAEGGVRAPWQALLAALAPLTSDQLEHRRSQAMQLLDENGIFFPGYVDDAARPRPWPLDPLPFQLAEAEWRALAAALSQRARLLDAVIGDLLGVQRLVRDRVIPARLLFSNPHYHRAYHDLPVPAKRYLTLYAADLIRDESGAWRIAGDRTQAPSGLGFALENRIAISQVHPSTFRQLHVRRLAPFFATLRQTLAGLSPTPKPNPRIVLLTEGPSGKRGIEDAYLSRYLGYALVEGPDLAARQGHTVLKTLGGALPVDIVLRRIGDEQCDPVELRGDSPHGVAGLLESVRGNRVVLANALGSQLTEARGLMAYLAGACRHLLGEELALSSVATWWCGEGDLLRHALAHADHLDWYPAFGMAHRAVDTRTLSRAQRVEFLLGVQAQPERWVAQERVRRATTPALRDGQLHPWYWALRCFLVASPGGFEALPGGLVRISESAFATEGSSMEVVRVQDCWVTSEEPVSDATLLPPQDQPVTLRRGGIELPSRVADNLYWLGRSIEDAEGTARLLRTVLSLASGESDPSQMPHLDVLTRYLEAERRIVRPPMVSQEAPTPATLEEALVGAVLADQRPTSLVGLVRECVRLAQLVRDRISVDAWRIVTRLERSLAATTPAAGAPAVDESDVTRVVALLNHVVLDLVTFGGLMSESMTRSLGWRFLDLGRRLERARNTAALLRATLVRPAWDERPMLEAVLSASDSIMTYRSRYLASLQPVPALDLLITDDTNPRSIIFQLYAMQAHVEAMPRQLEPPLRDLEQRISLTLVHALSLAEPGALAAPDSGGRRRTLDQLLTRLGDQLPKLDQAISGRYLIHAGLPRQFVPSLDALVGQQ